MIKGMTGRVAVLGSLNIDRTMTVRELPGPGETVLSSQLRTQPGAKGANQAVSAARLAERVTMLGKVGDDEPGKQSLEGLCARGVVSDSVLVAEEAPTGQAFITVDEHGENSIVVVAGANLLVRPEDLDTEAIANSDVLVTQLETPLETVCAAVRFAVEHGVRVVFNPSPVAEVPEDVLAAGDPVIVNEHEAAALPDNVRSVCVTLGAEGARWGEASASPPPVEVVDTTGAGDCFAGTLAAALANGQDRASALEAAVRASAEATTWHGAQPPVS